jgi:hypothetical protein
MVREKVTFLQVRSKADMLFNTQTKPNLDAPAIRFVLGDAYQSLSKEERQALLHVCSPYYRFINIS